MEYRISEPDDYDCDDEDEELDYLHDYVDAMKAHGRDELLDMLLILTNICDARALLNLHIAPVSEWYRTTGAQLRSALDAITAASEDALPNLKLENPLLYYDMNGTGTTH